MITMNNDNNDDNMDQNITQGFDSLKGVAFAAHFLAFIKQMIKGAILSAFRYASDEDKFTIHNREEVRDILRNPNFTMENVAQYLNNCWHSFHNKTDEYVVDKIKLIGSYGRFTHDYCIFNFIWNFGQKILLFTLGRIDVNELKDREFLSECLNIIIDAVSSLNCDDLIKNENKCGDGCEIKVYKKDEDFIKIRKLGEVSRK
jgi:hypothetical protein